MWTNICGKIKFLLLTYIKRMDDFTTHTNIEQTINRFLRVNVTCIVLKVNKKNSFGTIYNFLSNYKTFLTPAMQKNPYSNVFKLCYLSKSVFKTEIEMIEWFCGYRFDLKIVWLEKICLLPQNRWCMINDCP